MEQERGQTKQEWHVSHLLSQDTGKPLKTRENLPRHGKNSGRVFPAFLAIFKDTDIKLKTWPCNILFACVLAWLIKCTFRKQDTVLEPKTRPCNYIFVRVLPVSGPNASKWWNDEVLRQDTVWEHKTRPCHFLIGPCLTRTHHFGLFKLGMNPRLRGRHSNTKSEL